MEIQIIEIIIQLLIAIGTIGACIISLCLGYKSSRIKASAVIEFTEVFFTNNTGLSADKSQGEIIMVTITNIGSKPFKINMFCAYDRLKKKNLVILPDYTSDLCTEASHFYYESETGQYVFPKNMFIDSLKEYFGASNPNKHLSLLKKFDFFVTTNLSQKIKITPAEEFYNDCVNELT